MIDNKSVIRNRKKAPARIQITALHHRHGSTYLVVSSHGHEFVYYQRGRHSAEYMLSRLRDGYFYDAQ